MYFQKIKIEICILHPISANNNIDVYSSEFKWRVLSVFAINILTSVFLELEIILELIITTDHYD